MFFVTGFCIIIIISIVFFFHCCNNDCVSVNVVKVGTGVLTCKTKGVWWWSRNNRKLDWKCLEVYELDHSKSGTFQELPRGRKISSVILGHDIPS